MLGAAPRFWWGPPGWQARLLSPLAALYGRVAASRLDDAPREPVGAPVLCVGNPTVGGSGKTPVAVALAGAARARGLAPGFLSRGHGGAEGAARLVEADRDRAADVGDEPLLLARHAPTAVGRDRLAGARLLIEGGCDFLVMDDGFQSARIAIDLGLLVVDRRFGLGNGFCLPAGPLRAPLGRQLAYADALVAMGEGNAADPAIGEAEVRGLPVHVARTVPTAPEAVRGRRVLAFAGIGHPEKFFRSLEEAGAVVTASRSFPDHHALSEAEMATLAEDASRQGLVLATTAKDFVRLEGAAAPDFLAKLLVLEVVARFASADAASHLVEAALRNWARRAGES